MRVALSATAGDGGLTVAMPADAKVAAKATVWLVKFTPAVEVPIRRGENSGRTVVYHNSVRELTPVGHWTGEAGTISIARAALTGCTPGTCAVLLQDGQAGAMLGAVWVPGSSGI